MVFKFRTAPDFTENLIFFIVFNALSNNHNNDFEKLIIKKYEVLKGICSRITNVGIRRFANPYKEVN